MIAATIGLVAADDALLEWLAASVEAGLIESFAIESWQPVVDVVDVPAAVTS